MSTQPFAAVGLANPGTRYETTRHNVGAMVIDAFTNRYGLSLNKHAKTGMLLASVRITNQQVIVGKTRTYMNTSGQPVGNLVRYFSVPAEQLIVVHDDLDLPFGTIRLKLGGGEGGHNGLRSITAAIGTREYLRVRVGIDRPPGQQDPAHYVLGPFTHAEQKELPIICEDAVDALELLISQGLAAAQNQVHGKS